MLLIISSIGAVAGAGAAMMIVVMTTIISSLCDACMYANMHVCIVCTYAVVGVYVCRACKECV